MNEMAQAACVAVCKSLTDRFALRMKAFSGMSYLNILLTPLRKIAAKRSRIV